MGAQPSSAALYEVMCYALQGLSNIQIYCDDVFIFTRTIADHLVVLKKVLLRLAYHGLKISPRKCRFLISHLVFLGFEISKYGIKPEEDKLKALKDITHPRKVREIR